MHVTSNVILLKTETASDILMLFTEYINNNINVEVCGLQGSVYSGTMLLHCNGVLSKWSAV